MVVLEDTKGSAWMNPQAAVWIVHCILQYNWKDSEFYKPGKIVELVPLCNRGRISNI